MTILMTVTGECLMDAAAMVKKNVNGKGAFIGSVPIGVESVSDLIFQDPVLTG